VVAFSPSAPQPVGGAATAAAVTLNVVVPVPSPAPVAAITAQPTSTVRDNFRQLLVIWRVIATVRVAQAFDRIGDCLSRLPATPITDFLSGALLLVRRTLLPDVPTIPALTVSNVSVLEGDTGTTDAVFTVTLDKAYDTPVTVGYGTSTGFDRALIWGQILIDLSPGPKDTLNSTYILKQPIRLTPATAGEDYAPVSGLLTFAPGQTTEQVSVAVIGDTAAEPTETFRLDAGAYPLDSEVNWREVDLWLHNLNYDYDQPLLPPPWGGFAQGMGTIVNDDCGSGYGESSGDCEYN